jgi:hypothetical protein
MQRQRNESNSSAPSMQQRRKDSDKKHTHNTNQPTNQPTMQSLKTERSSRRCGSSLGVSPPSRRRVRKTKLWKVYLMTQYVQELVMHDRTDVYVRSARY